MRRGVRNPIVLGIKHTGERWTPMLSRHEVYVKGTPFPRRKKLFFFDFSIFISKGTLWPSLLVV